MNSKLSDLEAKREYNRGMLRSAFASLFWTEIARRKKEGTLTQSALADMLGVNKSAVSKWFSDGEPNWEIDTIADIALALDLEFVLRARNRKTGNTHTPYGIESSDDEDVTVVTSAKQPKEIDIQRWLNSANIESPRCDFDEAVMS